jgi:hypothetical protein
MIPSGGGVVRNMMATTDGNLVLACIGVNRIALVKINKVGARFCGKAGGVLSCCKWLSADPYGVALNFPPNIAREITASAKVPTAGGVGNRPGDVTVNPRIEAVATKKAGQVGTLKETVGQLKPSLAIRYYGTW